VSTGSNHDDAERRRQASQHRPFDCGIDPDHGTDGRADVDIDHGTDGQPDVDIVHGTDGRAQ
jgi:hypothetical protein